MEKCKHHKISRIYWRKNQKWLIIENFMICRDCEMIFKIKGKTIDEANL
jgi:hypothetical protein